MRLLIEIGHIYGGMNPGFEQAETVMIARDLIPSHARIGDEIDLCVLVDERNQGAFDITAYHAWIAGLGIQTAFVCYEGRLRAAADALVAMLPQDKLRTEFFRRDGVHRRFYVDGTVRVSLGSLGPTGLDHTCALLSAAWTLCRLGVLPFPEASTVGFRDRFRRYERTISVLPLAYDVPERQAARLIAAAGHERALDRYAILWTAGDSAGLPAQKPAA